MSLILAQVSGHPDVDRWNDLINATCQEFDVEPNLMKAHIEYESGGDPNIVGSSGRGLGLGQIDYGTAQDASGRWYYSGPNGTTYDIFDPATNLKIMARDFLLPLKQAFPNNPAARIAGYNAGIDAVQQAIANGVDLTTVTFDPAYIGNVQGAWEWYDESRPVVT